MRSNLPPEIASAWAALIAKDPTGMACVGPLLAKIAHDLESRRAGALQPCAVGGGRVAHAPVQPALQSHQDDRTSAVVLGEALPDAHRSFIADPAFAPVGGAEIAQSASQDADQPRRLHRTRAGPQ